MVSDHQYEKLLQDEFFFLEFWTPLLTERKLVGNWSYLEHSTNRDRRWTRNKLSRLFVRCQASILSQLPLLIYREWISKRGKQSIKPGLFVLVLQFCHKEKPNQTFGKSDNPPTGIFTLKTTWKNIILKYVVNIRENATFSKSEFFLGKFLFLFLALPRALFYLLEYRLISVTMAQILGSHTWQ